MSKSYVRRMARDGRQWVSDGIISEEQYQAIMSRYPDRAFNPVQLISLLGALLVGLGVILFFAANWHEIPRLVRLGLIYGLIGTSYYTGYRLLVHEHRAWLGTSLIFLGTLLFGSGIWLTGQMFHVLWLDASGFLYWALATVIMAHLLASPFMFAASLVQLTIYGLASLSSFHQWWYFYLWFAIIAVPFVVRAPAVNLLVASLSSLTLYTIVLLARASTDAHALILYGLLLLAVLQFIPRRLQDVFAPAMTIFGTAVGFAGVLTIALNPVVRYYNFHPLHYTAATVFLLALSVLGARLNRKPVTALYPFILFIPYFTLSLIEGFPADVVGILGIATFAIALVLAGARQEENYLVNLGSVYFLLATFASYVHFAWAYLPKSLFFIGAGIVLFVTGFVVERNRRRLLHIQKGGTTA